MSLSLKILEFQTGCYRFSICEALLLDRFHSVFLSKACSRRAARLSFESRRFGIGAIFAGVSAQT